MLEKQLYKLGSRNIELKDLLIAITLIGIVILFLWLIKKALNKNLKIDIGRKFAIFQIIKYFTIIISSALILQLIGIDVTVIIASSAALLVGFGLGMQHLFSDLAAGFIVLSRGTVKVGDIIELEGMIAKVKVINLRTTTVETRSDKNIIIPNSRLTNNKLINWSHSDATSRFEIDIGVDYSSDVNAVMNILKNCAVSNADVLENPEPFVRLSDFANSSLQFQLFFWTKELFRVIQIKSDIRIYLFAEFKKQEINIPFPQLTLHIKK